MTIIDTKNYVTIKFNKKIPFKKVFILSQTYSENVYFLVSDNLKASDFFKLLSEKAEQMEKDESILMSKFCAK